MSLCTMRNLPRGNKPYKKLQNWDVAPGQAIVEAAGGKVVGLDGSEIVYDAADFQVPPLVNISPNRAAAAAKPKTPGI